MPALINPNFNARKRTPAEEENATQAAGARVTLRVRVRHPTPNPRALALAQALALALTLTPTIIQAAGGLSYDSDGSEMGSEASSDSVYTQT